MNEYERAEVASEPRRPGAVDMLRDQNERLHHQIELLSTQLAPVSRMEPERADGTLRDANFSALDDQVALVAEAVEKLIRLRDLLVI